MSIIKLDATAIESPYDAYNVKVDSKFPTLADSTILISTKPVNISSDDIILGEDSTSILSIPILSDSIKYQIDDLCSVYNKYCLKEFNILCTGQFMGEQHNLLERINVINQSTNNAMFDYVMFDKDYYNDIKSTELYSNLQSDENKFTLASKYDELQEIVPRVILDSIGDSPKYTLKCTDSTGVSIYITPKIIDLGQTSSALAPKYFTQETTDSTSLDTALVDIDNLPMVLNLHYFQKLINDRLASFKSVELLIKLVNEDISHTMVIKNDSTYLKQIKGVVVKFNGPLHKSNIISSNSQFLNRGLVFELKFFKYDKFIGQYNDNRILDKDEKCIINYNLNKLTLNNLYSLESTSSIVNNSNNYITLNGKKTQTPLEIYDDATIKNIISIKLIDLKDYIEFSISDAPRTVMTLMKSYTSHIFSYLFRNTVDYTYKQTITNYAYLFASDRYDITNSDINFGYIITSNFNFVENTAHAICISDITTAFEEMQDDVNVDIQFTNFNDQSSIVYIRFNNNSGVNYTRKFLSNDIISIILNNIYLSVNLYNSENNSIYEKLILVDNLINTYSENANLVYMYKIPNKIMSINAILKKNKIDNVSLNVIDKPYIPNDVVIINKNKK